MNDIRKSDYAKLFTRRKDGVYQKYVNGKYLYSKDPEELYRKWQAVLNHEEESATFKSAAEEWETKIRETIGERTWNNYKPHYNDLISKFGKRRVEEIDAKDIANDLLIAKDQGYSATILKTRRTIMNQIMDQAVVSGHIKYNPTASVRIPKGAPKSKRTAPTVEEMQTIFSSIDEPFGFYAFFLLCTGLRKSEALALTKQDFDWSTKTINITKSLVYVDNCHPSVKPPKTENGVRVVPIVSVLEAPLKKYLSSVSGEIVFPSPKSNRNPGGGYMTEKAFEFAWKHYQEATGLTLTPHQLRHGTATIMFESGVDAFTAKQILGHSDITTTLGIYTELREKQQKKSITNLNRGMSKYAKGEKK